MPSPTPYPRPSPYAPPRQETIAGRGARIGAGVVGGPYGVGMIPNIFHDIMNGVRTGQRASSRRAWQRYMASRSQSSGNLPDPFADMEHGNLTGDYRNTILGGEWTSDPDFEAPPDPNYYPHGLHGDDGRLDAASLAGDYNDNPDDPAEFNLDAYIATHGPQQSPGAPIGEHSGYRGDIRNFGGNVNLGNNLGLFNGIPAGYGTRSPFGGGNANLDGDAVVLTGNTGVPQWNSSRNTWEIYNESTGEWAPVAGRAPGSGQESWQDESDPSSQPGRGRGGSSANPTSLDRISRGLQQSPIGIGSVTAHNANLGSAHNPLFGYGQLTGNPYYNPGTGWAPIGEAPAEVRWDPNSGTGNYVSSRTVDALAPHWGEGGVNDNGNSGDEGHDMFQLVMGQPTWQLDPHTGAMMHNGPIWHGHTSGSPVLGGDLTHEQLMLAQQLLQGNLTGGG